VIGEIIFHHDDRLEKVTGEHAKSVERDQEPPEEIAS